MWRPGDPKPGEPTAPTAPAAPEAAAKPVISSKLLGMKFMQRRRESDLRGRLRAEEAAKADEAKWVAETAPAGGGGAVAGEPRLQLEAEASSRSSPASATAILAFRPARKSFGDFNPKTASALAAVREAQATARAALDEAHVATERRQAVAEPYDRGTVDDAEMAARYASLISGRSGPKAAPAAGKGKRAAEAEAADPAPEEGGSKRSKGGAAASV
ncbi:hypothetical protein T492DRAFT_953041 [Pavlovales sp. CCMP2436]|nr:hypothetical protein T492DRAFT_953041 [Pavlovales sp. CCMP2436]|mmetsp:Transcript_35512/g.88583  ORF Transcript_35512/g.88583 Transcript_35512/m.88583 type:complete len:216 (+) Transcript_35512:74-721(+)